MKYNRAKRTGLSASQFAGTPEHYLGPTEAELGEIAGNDAWGISPAGLAEPADPRMIPVRLAEGRIPAKLAEIDEILHAADPLQLFGQLHLLNAFRRASQPGEYSFGSDALLEFAAGLITSMPANDVQSLLGVVSDARLVLALDNSLREYARLELLAHANRTDFDPRSASVERVRKMVEFEYLFDRKQGYSPHLESVGYAVLQPLDTLSLSTLGFRLSSAILIAQANTELQVTEYDVARDALDLRLADQKKHGLDEFLEEAFGTCAPYLADDMTEKIAAHAQLPSEEVRLALIQLSVRVGSQHVERLRDFNLSRNRPAISVDSNRFLWPRPNDFEHSIQDWAIDVCHGRPALINALDKSRQTVVEELTMGLLGRVFGEAAVANQVHYDMPGRPDIDILVSIPGALLIVEVKGGRFTQSAKRGAPDRVEKKRAELATKAIGQNARAWQYISAGNGTFWGKNGRRFPTPSPLAIPISLVVTLDRVDPLYSFSARWADTETRGLPRLVVNLPDLLLIGDILPSSHELYSYLRDRAIMASETGVAVSTEGDALGIWCEGRGDLWEARSVREVDTLGPGTDMFDDYYRDWRSSGNVPQRGEFTGIPEEILLALDGHYERASPIWPELAQEVAHVNPSTWKTVMRRIQRARSQGGIPSSRKSRRRYNALLSEGLELTERLRVRVERAGDGEASLFLALA